MTYDMELLTGTAEELMEHLEAIRKHAEKIMTYCTGECHNCPLKSACDWDKNFDFMDKSLTLETMADFIDFAERYDRKVQEEEENREADAWERANKWAGIDPGWSAVIRTVKL